MTISQPNVQWKSTRLIDQNLISCLFKIIDLTLQTQTVFCLKIVSFCHESINEKAKMVVKLHEFCIVFNVRSHPYSKANITPMVLSAMCFHCNVKSEIKQLSTHAVSHAIGSRLKETENWLVSIHHRKLVPASSLIFLASGFQKSG